MTSTVDALSMVHASCPAILAIPTLAVMLAVSFAATFGKVFAT